jgi:hypothetical protein
VGSVDVLETAAETRERVSRHDPGVPSNLALRPMPATYPAPSCTIRPAQVTSVRISSQGFATLGVLKSVARGVIQVLTSTSVPVRLPLQIAIAGCRAMIGEAAYSLRGSLVFQVGMVFSSGEKPEVDPGATATIHDLEPPYGSHGGTVLCLRNTVLLISSRTAIALGAWVRVELADWVLFGMVKEIVRATASGRWLEIHLHAAFAADVSGHGGHS